MCIRYIVVVCISLCLLPEIAVPRTAPRAPAAPQQTSPSATGDQSNETWTIPDRNRINEGTVTVITAPVSGATAIFGTDLARVLHDDATIRVLSASVQSPLRDV